MPEFAPQILRFDSLPSTNLEAAKRAVQGAPEGLCIVASEQTAGRGRLQRHWISPKNAGLYFSIILRPELDQRIWPLVTLMASIAVHDTLLDAYAVETDIKWPNDILVNESKLCGILAETVDTPLGRAIVVGIGINLTSKSFPPELEGIAASLEAAANQAVDPEVVLKALVNALGSYYQKLQQPAGTHEILRTWCAFSSYAQGKRIRVTDSNETFIGITRGLECDGALRVETDRAEIKIVRAGDVTNVRPWERRA
ncbi:MAG TPA: biotin--[acetyl-CoA-carboxylase] ligase [Blastocatellia bacterium]|nr:biotin--[acetyl-CoA-carboxylase] ligase [Blastocatellia bacterium]